MCVDHKFNNQIITNIPKICEEKKKERKVRVHTTIGIIKERNPSGPWTTNICTLN